MSNKQKLIKHKNFILARTSDDIHFFKGHYVNRFENFDLFYEAGYIRNKILDKINYLLEDHYIPDLDVDIVSLNILEFLKVSDKLRSLARA